MREGSLQGVTTDEAGWKSNDSKKDSQVLEATSETSGEGTHMKQTTSADEEAVTGWSNDISESTTGFSYPYYSRWMPSSYPPMSTAPYIAPPSPYAPYYYPIFPPAGVITPGVPLSNYPFTLEMAIVHQIEYYLGEENLAKDVYLRQLMDSEMWVEIEKLVTFPKLSRLTTSVRLVARVLREFSFRVQVHEDDERVRPTPPEASDEDRRLVIVKNVSGNISKEDFTSYVHKEMGESSRLKILSNMDDTWFVYCNDESDAERLCSLLLTSFQGNILEARRKTDDLSRHWGETMEFSKSNRQTALATMMMIPSSSHPGFAMPSYGNPSYVPMNTGMYSYPFPSYMFPLNAGMTDTSRNVRNRRRGSNRGIRGNTDKETIKVNESDMVSENKPLMETSSQMTLPKGSRGRSQEKNLKEAGNMMNGNISSGTDAKQAMTNHKSRLQRNNGASEKYSQSMMKEKNTKEPNLSLAEFPPLPSSNGTKLNSLFKSGKGELNSTNSGEVVQMDSSKVSDAKETEVFFERDSNISYVSTTDSVTEKASVPVLSFGDVVLTTENLSDVQESL